MTGHAHHIRVFAFFFLLTAISPAVAESPGELASLIDRQINRHVPESSRADLIEESAFIRRVTLDLAGRIPTAAELQQFRSSERLDKRAELVRRLIESPDFAFHQRNELDTLLLSRLTRDQAWREYLLEATVENRPWDQIFREVMSPEDACPDDLRPVAFLGNRVRDLDTMANDSSVIWFGVNIACAKCHDHPLVDDWKQSHYYGLASFFKRTFKTKKGFLGERFDGTVQYETTEGERSEADFMFLNGTLVQEPQIALDQEALKQYNDLIKQSERENEAEAPPRPDFRPRSQLVRVALDDSQQRFFAKNIVNRVWARMFGRGLIHPLDQIHSENPPTYPELLDLLCQDLIDHDYDLRRLIHGIALSDAYARALTPVGSTSQNDEEPSSIDLFARAMPRALSPHQLSLSLLIATRHPDRLREKMAGDWAAERESLERQSEGVARQLEIPDESFQVPVAEALWFSNNEQVQRDYLGAGADRLVGYLAGFESSQEIVGAATQSILTRDPTPEELVVMSGYLEQKLDRREEAIQHVVWALLSSPEFRFNH